MGLELTVIILLGYNLLLVELLTIAWMAWRYNGHASAGSGRLMGPFALILASIVMRIDVTLGLAIVESSRFAEGMAWQLAGVAQLWGAVVVGGFVCEHMVDRVRAHRRDAL